MTFFFKLLRGCSWGSFPGICRSASRGHDEPDFAFDDVGFRVVCNSSTKM
jgi:formylglycine-generating enzyme required for sulfatase activity